MATKTNMERLEALAATLPEAVRFDVTICQRCSAAKWQEVTEWVRTSYTLVAPKKLAGIVLEQDGLL